MAEQERITVNPYDDPDTMDVNQLRGLMLNQVAGGKPFVFITAEPGDKPGSVTVDTLSNMEEREVLQFMLETALGDTQS